MRVLFTDCEDAGKIISQKWFAGMSRDKAERINRLKHERDRNLAIAAHRLLCWGLKNEYDITPAEDGWREGYKGKPYLKDVSGIYFSISHSGSMAMCVIDEKEVGADIQIVKPLGDKVAELVLSDQEKRAYYDSGNHKDLFYKIWVLKEAYLKYKGSGIGNLQNITAYPVGGKIISNTRGCQFSLIEAIDGYQAAICSEGRIGFKTEHIKIGDLDVT
jgi:4'-phosphopantetheinyl transferase